MLSLCVVVILGINTPFVVDSISSIAEEAGVTVPMPTCEKEKVPTKRQIIIMIF